MQVKSELRRVMLSRRDSIAAEQRSEAGSAVAINALLRDQLNAADTVLCYVNIGSEMPTDRIIGYCLQNGISVAAPICLGENIVFRYINGFNDLEHGSFSVLEPKAHCPAARITTASVCITPAVCYNKSGFRIGYGKGYYDRFFSENKCIKIGLCYEDLIADFSPDMNDVAVDMIVTERRFRRINNG
ncbi:MAG: 5-formyltetrahydrofolate cyclo-ligase [Lachnospiraceae bacterium]|nr:5-formyltetrahydrofolate cyclo-ligase [Lachnospiraceae bacterium]